LRPASQEIKVVVMKRGGGTRHQGGKGVFAAREYPKRKAPLMRAGPSVFQGIAPSHESGNNAPIDKADPGTTLGMQILSTRKSASVTFLHHSPDGDANGSLAAAKLSNG
jgi:hypothetical protein